MVSKIKLAFHKSRLKYNEDFSESEDYIECKGMFCKPKFCCILGGIFFCLGFGMCCLMTQTQFSCHRSKNECLLQERHFWETDFKTTEKINLSDIKTAYVDWEENHDREGSTTLYFSKIKTIHGSKRISNKSSSERKEHQADVNKINHYLNDSDAENFELRDSILWWVFPGVFTLIGLLIMWIPRFIRKRAMRERNPIVER